jgi:hypothetical protein
MRRCVDSQITRPADTAIAITITRPAQSSILLNP